MRARPFETKRRKLEAKERCRRKCLAQSWEESNNRHRRAQLSFVGDLSGGLHEEPRRGERREVDWPILLCARGREGFVWPGLRLHHVDGEMFRRHLASWLFKSVGGLSLLDGMLAGWCATYHSTIQHYFTHADAVTPAYLKRFHVEPQRGRWVAAGRRESA